VAKTAASTDLWDGVALLRRIDFGVDFSKKRRQQPELSSACLRENAMPVEARAYPRPLPNLEWLGKLTEEILEPDLPIVDPHHHLWDHPGSRYLLDELLADVNSGHNIVATVFIQCGSGYRTSGPQEMRPIGESEFVRAIAEEGDKRGGKTRICAGIVSFADLRLPNVDAVLEGQIAAAGGRLRGIRQIAAHDPAIISVSSFIPPPGLMDDPNFRRGLKRLPAHNLTFEAWIYHPQIKTVTEVARECPDVKIVLNHFGGPLGCRRLSDSVFSSARVG
jgi:predicted TIM-barrel fold metal-dependent hydrolase